MKTVIIGGGGSGMAAATHLRRQDENMEIVVLEKSDEFAVAVCGLPYMLEGKIKDKDELIGATIEQMRRIFKIDIRLNTEVLSIEPKARKILLKSEKIDYDKLIIATGGLQLRPDIPGILADNIFTLHNLYSTQRIIDYFWGLNARNVVILGGNEIGLRAAEALAQNSGKVTIVDKATHILSGLDYDFADFVKQKLEKSGLNILTNTTIKEFLPDKALLGNGSKLKYDLAIIAAGSKAGVKLPIMADIEIGTSGGIVVNQHMETSVENILACGDGIELLDLITQTPKRIGDAATAIRSAKVAADNAIGIKSQIDFAIRNNIIKVFDLFIGMTGCNETELRGAGIPYHKLYFSQENGENYLASSKHMFMKLLFGLDGAILGLQACGKTGIDTRLNIVAALIAQKAKVHDMAEVHIAYFPELTRAKDAINNMGTMAEEINFDHLKMADDDNIKEDDVWLNVGNGKQPSGFKPKLAINIPLAALRENLVSLPKNKKIIISGNGGYDAYLAYCILSQRGFDNAFLLNSTAAWQ